MALRRSFLLARVGAWLLLILIGQDATGTTRPLAIADLLRLEGYGQTLFSPDGRVALFERQARYDRAPYYGFGFFTRRLRTHIFALDVATPGRAAPLFAQDFAAGYWMAGFSPSGRRLAVFRITAQGLSLGVVDMADRMVRWFALAPDLPPGNPSPVWLDEDRLMVAYRADGRLPMPFALDRPMRTLPPLWHAAARGALPSGSWVGNDGPPVAGGLAAVDVTTGRINRVWTGSTVFDVAFAPDHRHVALVVDGGGVTPTPDLVLDAGFPDRAHRLVMLGRDASPWQAVADVRIGLLSWRADSKAVLVDSIPDGRRPGPGRLVAVVPETRSVRALAAIATQSRPDADATVRIHAGWLDAIPVAEAIGGDGRSCWHRLDRARRNLIACMPKDTTPLGVRPSSIMATGPGGLVSISLAGRLRIQAAGPVNTLAALDPFALGLRAAANCDPATPVPVSIGAVTRRLRFSVDREEALLLGHAKGDAVAVSRSARAALLLDRTPSGVATLALLRSDGHAVPVDRINAHLADVAPPRIVRLDARMSDGRRHSHWLLLPPGPVSRLPLIVVPYPGALHDDGPPPMAPDRPAAISLPLLVAQGYAVLVPGLPADSGVPHPLERITADVARAVAAIPAAMPVDKTRVVIWGHSFGGYGALAVAASSQAFRAIVSADGISDLASIYGAMPPYDRIDLADGLPLASIAGWSEGGQARLRRPPWRRPNTYRRASPFFAVARMQTPLLLISGDQDYVPLEQAERLYVAMRRLGRPVALLRYWGEGHVLASPANIADAYARIFGWLAVQVARPAAHQRRTTSGAG